MAWIIIAIRNLLKNGRRSFFTITAIMLGYAAVVLFDGFINYMFTSLKESVIFARGSGHMTVFKAGFLEKGKIHPERYLISHTELEHLKGLIKKQQEVELLSPELHINGLISNGQVSTIFIASGRVPSILKKMKTYADSDLVKSKYYQGEALTDEDIYGVGIGLSLSRLMGMPIGTQDAVVVAPTIDGGMNALDARIIQTVNAGNQILEDKMLIASLGFAQTLYDTDAVDRVRILLKDEKQLPAVIEKLQSEFNARAWPLEVKNWTDLAPFYVKVKKMFELIFLFIFLIVITVVVMSIINTISMAIMERTQEIGTMRAIGLKRLGVIRLFVIESSLLVLIGSGLGLVITMSIYGLIRALDVKWTPPTVAMEVPLEIHLNYGHMFGVFLILEVLAIIATVLPARRAAYSNIVDALGHV